MQYFLATTEEGKFTAKANHSNITAGGKLGSRGVAAGILAIHQRDMQSHSLEERSKIGNRCFWIIGLSINI